MTAPTHLLQDILRQPEEMARTIDYLVGPGQDALHRASSLICSARHVFVTGIGASWHAAMSAGSLAELAGHPVYLQEAAELLYFTDIPRGAVVVALSRSGRSTEIVQLLAKAQASGATVIGITNVVDSPLARESAIALAISAKLDHAISVNTYSTLLIGAAALTSSVTTDFSAVAPLLLHAVREAGQRLESWQAQIKESSWPIGGAPYYFLGRGGSLGSCHEGRLLWEEGVKMPATAMSSSNFRHGPQEIVRQGMRFCIWIDQSRMRDEDLAVAHDLRILGASVMLIGEKLAPDAADLVCQLPNSPPGWQFVIDVLPVQIAAEHLSRSVGVDCDSFRVCSYVVEDEHGLLRKRTGAGQDRPPKS